MLFINNEKLDLKEKDSPYVKDYYEKKEWVNENLGFPVIFRANDGQIFPQVMDDGRITSYMPDWYIPNVSFVTTSDGLEEWRWSPRVPRIKDGEYQFTREDSRSVYRERMFKLNENQFDRIYFLMFKSPKFKALYSVDDAKVKATELVEAKKKEALVIELFYGRNSVLQKDEKKLREIARAWNVDNVKSKTKDQILMDLETTVREQDAKGIRTIDKFIEAVEIDYYAEVGSIIQKASENGFIQFDDSTSMWFYVDAEGIRSEKICDVPRQKAESKFEILREYILVERTHIARIQSILDKRDVSDKMQLDFRNLREEPWDKVAAYCNREGIATTGRGRTKDMVFKDIRKHVGLDE
jgi:hypothetical protein